MNEREESDQLPEEGPESQVPDDDGGGGGSGDARSGAEESAGGADEDGDDQEGQATGNPDAAG